MSTDSRGKWVLAATILASSMAFIDGTVVNVALPFLQTNLNATAIGIQWVVEAYALFLSALLLVGGSLGDRYGRRRIFNIGVVIFAIASALCGFAANIEQLIIARAVQGMGGALLVPGSLALISSSFDEDKRGKAIGTWSGFSAITTAIGPVLGGWLVEHLTWRAAFFLNLPLAVAVLVISIWKVPESSEKEHHGSLDWTGAALACGVMSFPLLVRPIRLSIEAIDRRLEQAAGTLGAAPWQVFATVTLPLALPGVLAGMVLGFAKAIGEFGATITFVSNIPGETQTISSAIYSLIQTPDGDAAAARLVLISVVIAMGALIASEWFARRATKRLHGN